MKLSERHETMLEAFLRRQSEAATHLPAERRAHAVSVLRKRIEAALETSDPSELSDRDLIQILDGVVASIRQKKAEPVQQAEPAFQMKHEQPVIETPEEVLPHMHEPVSNDPVGSDERVWLGVCLNLSRNRSVSLSTVRGAFLVFGLLTGPVALIVYLLLYISARASAESPPELSWGDVYRGIAGTLVWLLVLYGVALGFMMGGHFLYLEAMGRPPIIEGWDWLQQRQNVLFFCAVTAILPLSALSNLPVRSDWAGTLKKLVSAAVALYGVVLSFGLASFLTGLLLKIVEEYAG